MNAPLVSVIVPAYNSSATLRCALASIADQTMRDFEVLVVGDACTDDSEAAVREVADARFQWHNLPVNSGSKAAPINWAMAQVRGAWVAFLAQDDLWLPNHLATLLAGARAHSADLTCGLCAVIDPDGRHFAWGGPPKGWTESRHCTTPSSWLLRRDFAPSIGPRHDPAGLGRDSDVDYYQRIHRAGGKIVHLPQLTAVRFASDRWRPYERDTTRPQPAHLARLRADPRGFREEILIALADAQSRHHLVLATPFVSRAWADLRWAARQLASSILFAVLETCGRNRWPASSLVRWRYRRIRNIDRVRRGLRPLD